MNEQAAQSRAAVRDCSAVILLRLQSAELKNNPNVVKGALAYLRVLREQAADLRPVKLFALPGFTRHEAIGWVSSMLEQAPTLWYAAPILVAQCRRFNEDRSPFRVHLGFDNHHMRL